MKKCLKGLLVAFVFSLGLVAAIPEKVSAAEGDASIANPTGDIMELEEPEVTGKIIYVDENDDDGHTMRAPLLRSINSSSPSTDYYYNQLTDDDKLCYTALLNASSGNKGFSESNKVLISKTNHKLSYNWTSFRRAVEYDHPEELESSLCRLNITYYTYISNLGTEYEYYLYFTKERYSREQITRMESELNSAVNSMYSEISPSGDAFEKELAIHDALIANIAYDNNVSDNNLSYHEGHTAYGGIVTGNAVCDGYSKAFKLLLDKAGIESHISAGLGNGGGHAWNVVNIDGSYYEVDVTWDDKDKFAEYPYYYLLSHDYFNCTTADFTSHTHSIPGFQSKTTTHVTNSNYLGYLNPPVANGTAKSYATVKKVYEVKFDKVNSSAIVNIPYNSTYTYEGKIAVMPTDMNLYGYKFDNWYTQAEGGTVVNESTVLSGPTTVYAHWINGDSSTPYPVYLKSDTGNASITVYYGGKYNNLPENISRNGYIFDGWYTDTSYTNRVTAQSMVNKASSHNLYAKWMPVKSQVTLNANGGNGADTTYEVSFAGTYNDALAAAGTPIKEGHNFVGWYTQKSEGKRITSTTKVTATTDHILYAHWAALQYAVTLKSETGNGAITVSHGGKYENLPENLSRTGYDFAGWYTSETGGTKVTANTVVTTASDHILYARWTAKRAMVFLNTNDDNGSVCAYEIVYGNTYGDALASVKSLSKVGYTFDGWYTQATGGKKVTADTKVYATDNHNLYAHWIKNQEQGNIQQQTQEHHPEENQNQAGGQNISQNQSGTQQQNQNNSLNNGQEQNGAQQQSQNNSLNNGQEQNGAQQQNQEQLPKENNNQENTQNTNYNYPGNNNSNNDSHRDNPKAENHGCEEDTETLELPADGKITVGTTSYSLSPNGTATVSAESNKNIKSLTVTNKIIYADESFAVTEIKKNAYRKCKKLKAVKIGSNIQKIGSGAFSDCKNLKKITINANSLKSVGTKSFKNINKKATITIVCKNRKTYNKVVKMLKKAGAKKATYKFKKG